MAHQSEPMDVDCDFDNKENTFHHNVPCTEKGYEELDVSELNMKLRYSMTPASSPMSKSYTACPDNRYFETGDTLNRNENANLTRSLNSTMTKTDNVINSSKNLPLQSLRTEKFTDGNGNNSVLRQLEFSVTDDINKTVIVSGTNDTDENFSLPSSSSSALHTPEATTPTKEIKNESSPIMRGLKSVLNIFRSSTSPVPPTECGDMTLKQEDLSPADVTIAENNLFNQLQVVASTPIAAHKIMDCNTSKRSSPYKDSIVFNDDLEKELNWNNEKSSSPDKTPIHKMLLQNSKIPERKPNDSNINNSNMECNFHSIVEDMDVSNNGSILQDRTMTECYPGNHEISVAFESDSEFVDCETTFSKNESYVLDIKSVQQKISPKPSLDETKTILCTDKNTEFLDCDSPFSKNESYVLDIKEIHNKISPQPHLNDTKRISCTSNHGVNQTIAQNTTNISFGDLETNFDITVPSDYSDYSQATANILSELEKLEANEFNTNKHTDIHENSKKIKCAAKQQNNEFEVTTKKESNLVQQKEATESETNQFNNTQNKFAELETTLTEVKDIQLYTPEKIDVHSIVIDNKQCIKSPVGPENKNSQFQEINLIQDTSHNRSEANLENSFQDTNADKTLETTITQDSNKSANKNIVDKKIISQEPIETTVEISNNTIEKVPSEVSDVLQTDVNSIHIPSVVQEEIPVKIGNSLHKDVAVETVSVTQSYNIVDTFQTPLNNSPSLDEVIDHLKLECRNEISVTKFQTTENPSDIPLPDDDIDKEIVVSGISITSAKMTQVLTSETNTTVLETQDPVSVPVNLVNTLENFSNDSISNLETSGALLFEIQTAENIDSKPYNVEILENLYKLDTNSKQCNVLLELNNLSMKTDPHLSLAIIDLSSTAIEITEEKTSSDNNLLSKVDSSSDIRINEINDSVTCIVNHENIDDSRQSTNDLDKNCLIVYTPAHDHNTSQIEPMDITLNESLNLTHELPDLVNQTIVLAEESMQNTIIANETNMSKQVELLPILCNAEKIDHVETSKTESDLTECAHKFECNKNLMETISENRNQPINDEKQPVCETSNVEVHNSGMNLSDEQPPKVFTSTSDSEPMEVERIIEVEEIIVSANNSPYVSLMSGVEPVPEKIKDADIRDTINSKYIEKIENEVKVEDTFEEIDNTFVGKSNVALSPPITSKGYNFNFDEIDDPFATKTKIRQSPPLDTPIKVTEIENDSDKPLKVPKKGVGNRRKSQPLEKKKPMVSNKKFNITFNAKDTPKTSINEANDNTVLIEDVKDKMNTSKITEYKQVIAKDEIVETVNTTQKHEENLIESKNKIGLKEDKNHIEPNVDTSDKPLQTSRENKPSVDSVHAVSSDLKTTSSSEQSTYYSASASSTESFQSKNVFNLPEIDDVNFNPFTTKSKMRQSPPPDIEIENPFATKSKMRQSPPLNKEMDNTFTTRSNVKSSPDVSIISHSQSDTNRTVTLDESKLVQIFKEIEGDDKMETELMEKDTSTNVIDTTSSSKATEDQNLTAREINTEDEDTVEGPFIDAGDDIEETSDFPVKNDDMLQFNELRETAHANEDNLDGELFIDAQAFEFLLNQNNSNIVADSGKESLFLKFDPLFAKRMSSSEVLTSLNKAPNKQSTPTKLSRLSPRNEKSPIAGPSNVNVTSEGDNNITQENNEDPNITVTKPMMKVTPALNPAVTPRNKSITPVRSNRRSITFTSPAMAVIDRLLSMSANNSVLEHDSSLTSIQSSCEQTEADVALTQLRELLAEKEISVYNLRSESKELKDRLSTMETQVRILEADGQERLKKINKLNERLVEKTKINKGMAAVVEEYERTIASLIADIEQDKKRNAEERIRLINERDEQAAHLSSMEVSFSDLHSKYEKSKQVILTCKANEDVYKKTVQNFEEQVRKMQINYEMLKQHATAKLNHANQELEKINRAHEAEVVKLNAMIKRNQLLATSLQETLAQKTKANDELTAICDELINKVGSNK